MLLSEHGTDEPVYRRTIGEDAHDVGHEPDLLAQSLLMVVQPHLLTVDNREGGEHQNVGSSLGRHRGYVRESVAEPIDDRSVRSP